MRVLFLPLRIVFGLLLVLGAFATQAQQLRKVGYMPSWSGDANAIQYSKLTHINYAFAIPQSNGSIYAVDNGAKLQTIVSKAHAVGCKVMIAIGGWSNQGVPLDPTFETLAANPTSRAQFVNDAMYIVNQYGLDGVDIDWEYPDAGSSSSNFDALMAALQNALKPAGKLLSAAVIGSGSQGDGVSLTTLNRLDHLNVMAYDANNYDHSTYAYGLQCLSYWSGRGIAKNKIVLGVPFYGRPSWSSFATLVAQGADPNADTFNGNGYNGKVTIGNKATYVKNNGYGGIMMWELSQDATGSNSLLSVIDATLGTGTNPPPVTQGPYGGTARNIPGQIEAEDYDVGGQGVAYNDNTSGNSGNAYRSDDVDVEACSEGGYDVGYITAGEWLEYTVNVTAAGTYTLQARVAATAAGKYFTIDIPGSSTITVNVPNTGAWQTWQTVTVNNITMTAGKKVMRVNCSTADFNINYLKFSAASTPPPTGPVIVYQNCNNDPGYAVGLNVGTYTTAQLNALGIQNNDISRLVVQSGYQVTLYNNDNMDASGGSYTTTSNTDCLTSVGFNDLTSSIKVSLVTSGNQPPTVTLTAPANGSSANAPASITISANASDADGSISKVDFYNGSTLLYSDNSSPYSYTWTNVGAGTYTITAKATDNAGASTTSGAATVTVNNVTSGGCSGIAQYVENGGYVAGSKVKNNGSQYECKPWPYSGWCNGAAWAYGPGTGAYWADAWTLVGSCSARTSAEETATVNDAVLTNAPNPFSSSTTIEVTTAEAGDVSIKVYNKSGQVVKVISEGYLSAGTYQFVFDGSGMQADLYLVKCNTPTGVITRKIVKTE